MLEGRKVGDNSWRSFGEGEERGGGVKNAMVGVFEWKESKMK